MLTRCLSCNNLYKKVGTYRKNIYYNVSVCGKKCAVKLFRTKSNGDIKNNAITLLTFSAPQFKSNYERGFAIWLDKYRIVWKYENYKFKLHSTKKYIPDFYLPRSNTFIEIKGKWLDSAFRKFKDFYGEFSNDYNIILIDREIMRVIKCKPSDTYLM